MNLMDGVKNLFGNSRSFTQAAAERRPAAGQANPYAGIFAEPPASVEPHVAYRFVSTAGKRFDAIAVELGFADTSKIERVVAHCRREQQAGRSASLADAAVALGVLTSEQVQTIVAAQTLRLHVDANAYSTPACITWLNDLERRGFRLKIERVSAKELLSLREKFNSDHGATGDGRDLDQIEKGIELFLSAAAIGANDLRILVRERDAEVQIRWRGDYRVSETWSMNRDAGERLIRAIYVGLATVKPASYNPQEFQDAQITARHSLPDSGLESIRLIRGPMYPEDQKCSFMVARLQYNPDAKPSFTAVLRPLALRTPDAPKGEFSISGMTARQRELAQEILYKPHGMVIATGPTGSGKTSTLYEFMKEQARLFPTSSQITIENPPEYPYPWAITLTANDNFVQMIKYSLRMDPDIILLSEIRAGDEGVAAVQAAMTGHFVWTTLHVTDPYMALSRLETIDHVRLTREITCDHELMVSLIAQRVVQVLCKDCRVRLTAKPEAIPKKISERIATWGDLSRVYVRGPGCPACDGQGVTGRQGVMEIIVSDEELMDDYRSQGMRVARRNHRIKPTSDKSMLGNAMDCVFDGLFDPIDVHRGVSPILAHAEGL
ncbi:ATPase, T2SS/T4P/T4SS family [Paraburkholderia sp. BR10872]|uniref:ATPase, T2SS/T4P/T4SS family n=1 Tax=Paraburkholderia sp. BR10872 TaxID=3236989 RepID=UPI0034D29AB4